METATTPTQSAPGRIVPAAPLHAATGLDSKTPADKIGEGLQSKAIWKSAGWAMKFQPDGSSRSSRKTRKLPVGAAQLMSPTFPPIASGW
jgi:hypothetical protein